MNQQISSLQCHCFHGLGIICIQSVPFILWNQYIGAVNRVSEATWAASIPHPTGSRASVTSAEDSLPCVYSALCAHTWPSNGVDGYWQKHLTSVWKLMSGATGPLTGTRGRPECAALLSFVIDLPLTLDPWHPSVRPHSVKPRVLLLWAESPAASPCRSVSWRKSFPFLYHCGALCFPGGPAVSLACRCD